MQAGVLQVQQELEDAGMTSGAGPLAVFRRIVVPLVSPALVNGLLWVAAHSMRDLTFPLLLVARDNVVVGTLLWEYWSAGRIPEASAVAIFLVLALVLLVFPVRLYSMRAGLARTQL
jgi:iron(III) transport system permease protein